MPLTEFAGGEDWLLGGARAGKENKKSTYAALAELRKKERQEYIDAYAPAVEQYNFRKRGVGLRGPDPRNKQAKINPADVVDTILGKSNRVDASTLNEIDSIALGQNRDVVGLLQTADFLGIPAIAQVIEDMTSVKYRGYKTDVQDIPGGKIYKTAPAPMGRFGGYNPLRQEATGGDKYSDGIISSLINRLPKESVERYSWIPGIKMPVFDPQGEYGRGLGEYTAAPTAGTGLELALAAAPIKLPGAGRFGSMAFRKGVSALEAASRAGIKPSTKLATASGIGGIIAATQLAQPEEAEALSMSNAIKFINSGKSPLKRLVGETPNAKARKTMARLYGSLEKAKELGVFENIPDTVYLQKITEAVQSNPKYVESIGLDSVRNNDWQVLHSPGKSLGRGLTEHTKDNIVYGSQKLNVLDENMQRSGSFAKNWKEVIEWGIKNDPSLSGKSLTEAAEQLGALHLI